MEPIAKRWATEVWHDHCFVAPQPQLTLTQVTSFELIRIHKLPFLWCVLLLPKTCNTGQFISIYTGQVSLAYWRWNHTVNDMYPRTKWSWDREESYSRLSASTGLIIMLFVKNRTFFHLPATGLFGTWEWRHYLCFQQKKEERKPKNCLTVLIFSYYVNFSLSWTITSL